MLYLGFIIYFALFKANKLAKLTSAKQRSKFKDRQVEIHNDILKDLESKGASKDEQVEAYRTLRRSFKTRRLETKKFKSLHSKEYKKYKPLLNDLH